MALNDIYRVTCTQRYTIDGPFFLNVFYYQQNTAAGNDGADVLLANFSPTVRDLLRLIQNEVITWLQIVVENIVPSSDNASEFYTPGTVQGNRVGECLPPFATWAFRFNRSTSASRHGQKRIGGVTELDQVNGAAVPGITPALTNAAAGMEAVLGGPLPANATYAPIIFRAGAPAKTIPEKIIPAKIQASFPVAGVSYTTISTQNTRKLGVGI